MPSHIKAKDLGSQFHLMQLKRTKDVMKRILNETLITAFALSAWFLFLITQ